MGQSAADDLSKPERFVASLISRAKPQAPSLVIETMFDSLEPPTKIRVCAFLAASDCFASVKPEYLASLADDFPVEVASIRASLIVHGVGRGDEEARCREAIAVVNAARGGRDNPIVCFNLAYLHARLREKSKAIRYAKRSVAASSNGAPLGSALMLLIRVLRSNCQSEDAAAIAIGSCVLLAHYHRDILIEGIYAAAECGDLATTETLFKCLRTHFKVDPVALQAAVRLNLMLGKTDSAAGCFQTWADVDQQSAEFFFGYAQLCFSAKDFAEAESALTSATELQPFNGNYHAALANLLFRLGQEEKALTIAKYAVKIDPDSVHAWFALANVSHNPAEASEALAKATDLRKTVIDLAQLSLVLTTDNV
jgi:hypothetical protein